MYEPNHTLDTYIAINTALKQTKTILVRWRSAINKTWNLMSWKGIFNMEQMEQRQENEVQKTSFSNLRDKFTKKSQLDQLDTLG